MGDISKTRVRPREEDGELKMQRNKRGTARVNLHILFNPLALGEATTPG